MAYDMLSGVAQAMVEGMTVSQNPMNSVVIEMMKDNSQGTKLNNESRKAAIVTEIGTTAFAKDTDTPPEVRDALKKIMDTIVSM